MVTRPLSNDELAIIRAALRFWRDEMVTADLKTRRHYLDLPETADLTSIQIEALIARLQSADA